jgi:hypothetical protein
MSLVSNRWEEAQVILWLAILTNCWAWDEVQESRGDYWDSYCTRTCSSLSLAAWSKMCLVYLAGGSLGSADRLTINVPVVYMAQGIMILKGEIPFWGPTPSNGPSNGFALIKIIKSKRHIKTGTLVILCTWVLLQVYSVFCILYCMLWVLCDFQGPPLPKALPLPLPPLPPSSTGTKWIHFALLATPSLPHPDKVNLLRPGRGGRGRGAGLSIPPSPPSPFVQNKLEINSNKKGA